MRAEPKRRHIGAADGQRGRWVVTRAAAAGLELHVVRRAAVPRPISLTVAPGNQRPLAGVVARLAALRSPCSSSGRKPG